MGVEWGWGESGWRRRRRNGLAELVFGGFGWFGGTFRVGGVVGARGKGALRVLDAQVMSALPPILRGFAFATLCGRLAPLRFVLVGPSHQPSPQPQPHWTRFSSGPGGNRKAGRATGIEEVWESEVSRARK